jgi:hypothetical protein
MEMGPAYKVDNITQSAGGMWESGISRDQLLQKISLLAMLGRVRDGIQSYSLAPSSSMESVLDIDQEAEIASNLAFLSRRRNDLKSVAAVGIEEDEYGQGMVIRVCVNGDTLSRVEEGLKEICGLLEEISRRRMFLQKRSRGRTYELQRTRKLETLIYYSGKLSRWTLLASQPG